MLSRACVAGISMFAQESHLQICTTTHARLEQIGTHAENREYPKFAVDDSFTGISVLLKVLD